jgi:hypothetical protein
MKSKVLQVNTGAEFLTDLRLKQCDHVPMDRGIAHHGNEERGDREKHQHEKGVDPEENAQGAGRELTPDAIGRERTCLAVSSAHDEPPSKCLADGDEVLSGADAWNRVEISPYVDANRSDWSGIAESQPDVVGI